MRYMHMGVPEEQALKVVSIAAWDAWHDLNESIKFGEAIRRAIKASHHNVMVLASGSLSHRFSDNSDAMENMHRWTREFDRQIDIRVVEMWRQGHFKEFRTMLPEYAQHCYGEGGMHDTAMLLGVLGEEYDTPAEILTEPFGSSGTGQINAIFPL